MMVREPGSCLFRWQLTLLFSLFFLWGAANNLNDVLIRQFTKAFALSNVRASLVQTYADTYILGAQGSLPLGGHYCTSVVRIPALGLPYVLRTVAPQVQTCFYGGYFCGALPAAWIARRRGFRVVVILGLGLFSAGALSNPEPELEPEPEPEP